MNLFGVEYEEKINVKKIFVKIIYRENFFYLVYCFVYWKRKGRRKRNILKGI